MTPRSEADLPLEVAGVARELEAVAATSDTIRPSAAFSERVARAVAAEPTPAPALLAADAVRRGRMRLFFAALVDAWRVMSGTGRPLAARAQALGLVLVALLIVGTAGGLATYGVAGLLGPGRLASPSVASPLPPPPTESVPTSPQPSPSPSALPSEDSSSTPSEAPSTSPASSSNATNARGTPTPTRSPRPSATSKATSTPTPTPHETETPSPTSTEDSGGGGGGSGGGTTPTPTSTPGS